MISTARNAAPPSPPANGGGSEQPDAPGGVRSALLETKEHKKRLDKILKSMGRRPSGMVCEGIQGLIEEGNEMMEEDGDPKVLDAGIIAAAQKVEHYEMSGYGTARAFAERLGELDAVDLLQATLDEEKAADQKLTRIAAAS
jgi:ferritin-like metal-binding protein YciE